MATPTAICAGDVGGIVKVARTARRSKVAIFIVRIMVEISLNIMVPKFVYLPAECVKLSWALAKK
jgi:hypothetical protein